MEKTREGLPVVTREAIHLTADIIRGQSSIDLLAEIAKDNPLIVEVIERFADSIDVREKEKDALIKEMASLYILLKCQGGLDQK